MTIQPTCVQNFVTRMENITLADLKIIAVTHRSVPLEVLGKLHIDQSRRAELFTHLKHQLHLKEFMYLSTCNRVEFMSVGPDVEVEEIIQELGISLTHEERNAIRTGAEHYCSDEAVKHLFKVSASLDSMVIGEREIITQVRTAYEDAAAAKLTGDLLRLVIKKTVETAKEVFTATSIFRKPVSVVSLAFHRLREMGLPTDSRVLMIGAGKTNRAMFRFLTKHGYRNITIFNRTETRARDLASEAGCRWQGLQAIESYSEGFDIMITCTGAEAQIVSKELLNQLIAGESGTKLIVDLAVPGDIAPDALEMSGESLIHYIGIDQLRAVADKNLSERSQEVSKCEEIIDRHLLAFHDLVKARQVELAMRTIPGKVKEIRERALNNIYASEIDTLSPEAREVLDKVIAYMEKKYISVPMKMAREVILNHKH